MKKTGTKIFIIGIDGATFNIINPLIEAGKLPVLKSLRDEGASGILQSQVPPYTWVAISSLLTGTNPGKHGVFDITVSNHHNYKVVNSNLTSSSSIKSPTIWDILTLYDKKSVSLLYPLSYPPVKVKGVMVSKIRPKLMKKRPYTYPATLSKELIDVVGDFDIRKMPFNEAAAREYHPNNRSFFSNQIENLKYKFEIEKKIIRHFLNKNGPEWDVFMVYFNNTDLLQHWFWRFIDKGHHLHASDRHLSNAINEGYEMIDTFIGEICSRLDDDTSVIIFSDHGFGPYYYRFHVNNWLQEKNLLFLKEGYSKQFQYQKIFFRRILLKTGLSNLVSILPKSILDIPVPLIRRSVKPLEDLVDWERTKAYGTLMGININLKGRESRGIVEHAAPLTQFIMSELRNLKDARGNKIIDTVYLKEDIYKGPLMDQGTDILFSFNKTICPAQITLDPLGKDVLSETSRNELISGTHFSNGEGIFFAKGPMIKSNHKIHSANIIDILPTVLYMLGLPVHPEVDGHILTDIFDEDYFLRNQATYAELPQSIAREYVGLDDEEKEIIKNELRNLGYME